MIEREQHDDVAVLRMVHGKANAFDTELCLGLDRALQDVAKDTRVHAVVLTGSGTIFSAGVDLKRVIDGGAAYVHEFLPALSSCFDRLLRFPRPLVAAINGHAIAGGCVVACAADIKLMADDNSGRIGVPELLVGVPFPSVALELMRFSVARQHLQSVVYFGGAYRPDKARSVGLIDDVATSAELLEKAIDQAKSMGTIPRAAFTLTKRQLRAPVVEAIARARERDDEVAAYWCSPGGLEAVRRYVERMLTKSSA